MLLSSESVAEMNNKPRHRPENKRRTESMILHYNLVISDSRIMDSGDYRELYGYSEDLKKVKESEAPFVILPDMTNERWSYLLTEWIEKKDIDDINGISDDERKLLNWFSELQDAQKQSASRFCPPPRKKIKPEDLLSLKFLERFESITKKMKVYNVAAASFNNQLSRDQLRGERINEKPTTGSAIQRALNRQKTSV